MSSPRSREAAAPRPLAVALSWPGKEDAWAADEVGEAAPRLIAEDGAVWEGARAAENLLIMGDSLRALSALGMSHHAAIRCAYLDPPFNTGVPFADYGDRDDHGRWLAAMAACARRVRRLLRADGSLWFHLDDHEVHYMKVLLDEIFGRDNFVASVVWQRVFAKKNKALISGSHDTILVYARDLAAWRRNLLPRDARQRRAFKNPDADPRGPWQSVSYSVRSEGAERRAAYRYPIALPAGGFVDPPAGRHWNGLPERTAGLRADGRLWFGVRGDRAPRLKVFLSEVQGGIVPDSWWPHELCGSNQEAKRELLRLFPGEEPFITPKPERLLARILGIASDPGDLVLDPFAGSGTTGAVAHKLGRRWVMIERNEASYRRIAARLRRVIDGEDPGGISEAAGWGGGGDLRGLRVEGTDRPGGRGEAAIRPVGGVADQ